MPETLAIVEMGMRAEMDRLGVISHNLANASTPGFRREIAIARPFGGQLTARLEGLVASGISPLDAGIARVTDDRPGSLQHTGNPLDIAIEGPGYLTLVGPEGALYSRRGALQLAANGQLTGPMGLPVMGRSRPVQLDSASVRIDETGAIWDGDVHVDDLAISELAAGSDLEPLGGGVYAAPGVEREASASTRIRQHHLEGANVSVMREMVLLMETMRRFEAIQNVVKSYDDVTEQALRTIGDL